MAERTIVIKIDGDAGNYQATIDRITERTARLNKDAIAGAQQTTKAFFDLGSQVGLLLKGFIAFEGLNFIRNFSAFAEQLNLVSKRTQITVEDLDALQRVATVNGS